MYSFDFGEIEALQAAGRWDEATDRLAEVGAGLARGGADFLMICCNTMHLMAEAVEEAARIPLLHIADPLAARSAPATSARSA
jgi:aspartate racemase